MTLDTGALFVPALGEKQKRILAEYFENIISRSMVLMEGKSQAGWVRMVNLAPVHVVVVDTGIFRLTVEDGGVGNNIRGLYKCSSFICLPLSSWCRIAGFMVLTN